jgi:hypothetical protein
MFKLKSCPKCKGDLIIEQVHNNQCEYCLQCGYQRELQINTVKNKCDVCVSSAKHTGTLT